MFSNQYQVVVQIDATDSPYTVVPGTDLLLVDATSGAVSVVMYPAGNHLNQFPAGQPNNAGSVAIQKSDAGGNAVTISAAAGNTIASPSLILSAQYQTLELTSDGSATFYGLGAALGSVWGSITGSLASQTDLVAALALKANAASPTFTGIVKAPLFANGFRTQATAAGTTTLVASDVQTQAFTGVTTQIVALPVVFTLSTGFSFKIVNNSTGALTVNSSGGNLVQTIAAGGRATVECILITGTDASSWAVTTPSSIAVGVGTSLAVTGLLKTSSATAGFGFATGAGGAVTQASSRTTGVTVNTSCGAITLVSAAGSGTAFSFTVTNSAVAATDTIIVHQKSGTDLYRVEVTAVGAGSFQLTVTDLSGTTTEQPVFNFSLIKAVAA